MLQNVLRPIKYIVVIALFLLPIKKAMSVVPRGPLPASPPPIRVFETDTPSYQLYYFWDLRDRDSFLQLSNESLSNIIVHIQIFDANNGCSEYDFIDKYTPFDSYIYNVAAFVSNDGSYIGSPSLPEGDFGFIVVTVIKQSGGVQTNPVLTGNFRIFDKSGGYEYGAKAAGYPASSIQNTSTYTFNYNGLMGTNQSDVVGIAVSGAGTAHVFASPSTNVVFKPLNYDLNEDVLGCAPVTFACDSTHFDYGINSVVGNSKGGTNICGGEFGEGMVNLQLSSSNSNFFVGFIGLNNSGASASASGIGNMNTFWAIPLFTLLKLPLFNNTP